MELTTLISIIALIGTLIQAILTYIANNKKNHAEAENLNANSSDIIIRNMRVELDRYGAQIKELQQEINILKTQEKIHLIEKIRLEERIQNLIKENEELRNMVEENKISYTSKILGLNELIEQLQKDLSVHSHKKK